jgi:hypothetical protein
MDTAAAFDPMKEIEAMRQVAEALKTLPTESVERVLDWAAKSFGVARAPTAVALPSVSAPSQSGSAPRVETRSVTFGYSDLPSFFAAASPSNGPEKALIVAYWKQLVEENDELDATLISAELKDMGHSLANISATVNLLMNQRPALVVQTRRMGKGERARKRYKVTAEGIRRVSEMLSRYNSGVDA